MQVTIYIQKDDEAQWGAMKKDAKEQKIGVGALLVKLIKQEAARGKG